jgi:hypothetical protein
MLHTYNGASVSTIVLECATIQEAHDLCASINRNSKPHHSIERFAEVIW